MARDDFLTQLKQLGFEPIIVNDRLFYFDYTIPVGRNIGIKLQMGFELGNDFPINCPHGPHFKLKNIKNWIPPNKGIHPSPFGNDWQHWSRPFKDWNKSKKTVKIYMSHIRKILADI